MKFGKEQVQATPEQLQRLIRLHNMRGNFSMSDTDREELFKRLAASQRQEYYGIVSELLERSDESKVFSVGSLVKILTIPPAHVFETSHRLIQDLQYLYGYVAIVSGPGIYGADIYFIDHGPLNLAAAADQFSKLHSLK